MYISVTRDEAEMIANAVFKIARETGNTDRAKEAMKLYTNIDREIEYELEKEKALA